MKRHPPIEEEDEEVFEFEVDLFNGWYVEPHQDPLWQYLQAGGKRACCVWHRRAGKDDISLRWTMDSILERPGNYWHMLPQAEQARKAIWTAINPHSGKRRIDETFPEALRKTTRNNEMMIEFKTGSIWQVLGSDNYNSFVGSPPVGVVFSEWSLADPSAWAYIRPILRENGGWAIFIYTPRGRNHGLSLYNSAKRSAGWFHEVLSAEKTDIFTPEGLKIELEELQSEFGEELGRSFFEQEYLVSFDAANIGAIYAGAVRKLELAGRICNAPHDPDYTVNTAWDLGFSDHTCIWFWQQIPGEGLRIIDHYRNAGQDPEHFASRVYGREIRYTLNDEIELGAPLPEHAHRIAYRYAQHFCPHDGAQHTLAAGGRSVGDQMHRMGISMVIIPATDQVNQISAARRTLEYCTFDQTRCEKGLDALRSYHYKWDADKKTLSDTPVHDWSSHDSDAFEIIGQVWQPLRAERKKDKPRFLHEASADEVFWPKHGGEKWRRERI